MTWIGGNSLAQDRVNVWDGLVKSDMRSYSDWAPSDPTNNVHLGENCMVMHHSGSFKWLDAPCQWEKPYICEKRA